MNVQVADHASADTWSASPPRYRLWGGRILGGLAVLFLMMDGVGKVLRLEPSVQGTVELGYADGSVVGIGVLLLVCTIVYAVPRTSVLGAVLLTGYLGGAVATHVRLGNPLFSHALFPVYIALMLWGAIYLLDDRIRALLPLRRQDTRRAMR